MKKQTQKQRSPAPKTGKANNKKATFPKAKVINRRDYIRSAANEWVQAWRDPKKRPLMDRILEKLSKADADLVVKVGQHMAANEMFLHLLPEK